MDRVKPEKVAILMDQIAIAAENIGYDEDDHDLWFLQLSLNYLSLLGGDLRSPEEAPDSRERRKLLESIALNWGSTLTTRDIITPIFRFGAVDPDIFKIIDEDIRSLRESR